MIQGSLNAAVVLKSVISATVRHTFSQSFLTLSKPSKFCLFIDIDF